MCQTNSKKLNKWSAKGYRVYIQYDDRSRLLSYYNCNFAPNVGVRTKRNTPQKFHMFKDVKSIVNWFNNRHYYSSYKYVIYECRMSGNMTHGIWEDKKDIKTVMGDYCTLLHEVTLDKLIQLAKLKAGDFNSSLFTIQNLQGKVE